MTYEQALATIEKKYRTHHVDSRSRYIFVDYTYDGHSLFYIELRNEEEGPLLSDGGNTKEIFDEVSEREWRYLCQKHHFVFNHWKLQRPFKSMKDLDAFIRFLDLISNRFERK